MDVCMDKLSLNSDLKTTSTTSIDDLPHGLMFDIFSRIPVKTLIQSTCVSKLWFSLIKTPSLVSEHLSRSISDPSCHYLFISYDSSPSLTVISEYPLVACHHDFKFPFQTQSTDIQLIGSCNGLICVTDSHHTYEGRDIYLVNPFIHKYKRLGVESSCYADFLRKTRTSVPGDLAFRNGKIDFNIGFGYSEVDNDYKVLRTIKHCIDSKKDVYVYKVEIYSLKNDIWKAVDVSIPIEMDDSPAFVHGCLYWSVLNMTKGDKRLHVDPYLLCFDLNNESCSRIEFPKTYFELFWTWSSDIFVKNGSLAIVLCTKDPESVSPVIKICLLVLEKKSSGEIRWEEFNYECANFNPMTCITLCGGGKLICVAYPDLLPKYIVAVDLDNSCAIERLALDLTDADHITEATDVSESLVLLSD